MTHLTLVVNPASGHGRAHRLTPRILSRLREAGIRTDTLIAQSWEQARTLCQQAAAAGTDGLLVAGGDGMAHLGYNACANTPTPLGIIPCGTGNDFARAVGIPRQWAAAVEAVIAGGIRQIDLMGVTGDLRVGNHAYVGSVVSTGFDERVTERAERLPVDLGALSYSFAALQELRQFTPLTYQLSIDGAPRTQSAMLVAVANAGIFGGGMRIAPDYDLEDGLLDVTIIHPVSRRMVLQLYPRLFTGTFVAHPAVERLRALSITVDVEGGRASADGEVLGRTPVSCTAAPGAVGVFVPAELRR
ncbi:MAG: diacylglycerol/lipid kinase family protein [Propioniciclava sp.]